MPSSTPGKLTVTIEDTPEPEGERSSTSADRPRRTIGPGARRILVMVAESVLVGVVGTVIAALVVRWQPSLWRSYFDYEGDTFFNAINGALATPLGVTDVSTRVGWPYGLTMIDFPAGEPLFTWFQWLGTQFVHDQFTVLAMLWFLGFLLVGAVTYLCLRGLGFSRWPSVVAALVYDFVPFHLARATGHTNLALYMAVPLAVMVLLWVLSGRLDRPPRSDPDRRPLWRSSDWCVVAVSVVVIALSARYYAVFFLILLFVVGAGRTVAERRLRLAWTPVVIALWTLGVALLSGLPQILQTLRIGGNSEVANRARLESDLYSLRLTDLLAPVPDHRLGFMRRFSNVLRNTVTSGEFGNSMGWFLVAGLVFVGIIVLLRRWPWWGGQGRGVFPVRLADHTAVIAVLAFLLGTVGGIGGLIASLGYTQIRSWNRISIFVSFCAAVGVALVFAWLWTLRRTGGRWRRFLPVVAVPLVLVLAILDQTGTVQPSQAEAAARRDSDTVFFMAMADQLGTGSAVFQLPYVAFPESGGVALDYAGFRGSFNDGGRLNYSYGGMRGRESDWQRTWVEEDLETQMVGLAAAGFSAIVVDRVGYTTDTNVEPGLQKLLGASKGVSPDARFAWYDVRPVVQKLTAAKGAEWMAQVGARVVRPIGVQIRAKTFRSNGDGSAYWGSLGVSSTIELRRYNGDTTPVDVAFGIRAQAGHSVTVTSGTWQEVKATTGDYVMFARQAAMTDSVLSVLVTTDAPNTAGMADARPDVRAELANVRILDSVLAQQIARGELKIPS